MADTPGDPSHLEPDSDRTERDGVPEQPLSERFLDLFVFLPTGLVVTVAQELPRLTERGRERLGVQVNSARSVGLFAVKAGTSELKKRSDGLRHNQCQQPDCPNELQPDVRLTHRDFQWMCQI